MVISLASYNFLIVMMLSSTTKSEGSLNRYSIIYIWCSSFRLPSLKLKNANVLSS